MSQKRTFFDIRKILQDRAPYLPNFYFICGGAVVKDEFVQIDQTHGHVVLNVSFCGEMRGGSDTGGVGRDDISDRFLGPRQRKWRLQTHLMKGFLMATHRI